MVGHQNHLGIARLDQKLVDGPGAAPVAQRCWMRTVLRYEGTVRTFQTQMLRTKTTTNSSRKLLPLVIAASMTGRMTPSVGTLRREQHANASCLR